MSGFVGALKSGVDLMKRGDDDTYDRMSSRYSVALCLVFAFLISGGQYIGDPIDCFTPGEFTPQWFKYTDQYCWVANTYYVPYTENVPRHSERKGAYIGDPIDCFVPSEFTSQWVKYTDQYCWVANTYYVAAQEKIPVHDNRRGLEIGYYQWTPIILAFQAFLFTVPGLMWKVFSSGAGYDIHHIVGLCNKGDNLNPDKRDGVIAYLTNHLDRLLGYRREYRSSAVARFRQAAGEKCCMVGKRYGNYLFILYMVTKILYIAQALFQLFALNFVIGEGFHMFGIKVIADLVNNKGWEASPFFPRVTLCDFKMRRMGNNVHNYTVQCVLPWNLFNEKIYIFLWWWLVVVVAMSILGFLVWCVTLLPNSNVRFVGKYLKVMNRLNGGSDKERKLVQEFTNRYLRQDGVFVLRMLALQVNDLTAAEVVCSLWDKFISYRSKSMDDLPMPKDI